MLVVIAYFRIKLKCWREKCILFVCVVVYVARCLFFPHKKKKITKNKSNGMPGRWEWVNIHHASFVV